MLIIILSLKSLAVMWLLNAVVVAGTVAVALWLFLLYAIAVTVGVIAAVNQCNAFVSLCSKCVYYSCVSM